MSVHQDTIDPNINYDKNKVMDQTAKTVVVF